MVSPCYPYNCISLPPLPPLPPFPPIKPNDSFDNNSNNQHTEVLLAFFSTAFFVLIVFSIVRCSRDSRAHHDEPLPSPLPTLAPSTITTIQTTNPNNNGDENDDRAHHVWLIRTVGLDDHIVKSIASSVYNGTNHVSIEYCSVCLGEFCDGEEIKLLHNCCHLFHALCIDTWLKSHVNCPLCRKPVMDGSDHSEPKQEDRVITVDSVSEFESSSSWSIVSADDIYDAK